MQSNAHSKICQDLNHKSESQLHFLIARHRYHPGCCACCCLVRLICKSVKLEFLNFAFNDICFTRLVCQASQHEHMADLQQVAELFFINLLAASASQILVQLNHLPRWLASEHAAKPGDTFC